MLSTGPQRSVVLVVLEHDAGIARTRLEDELGHPARETITEALAHLSKEEVVAVDGDRVHPSRCARRLGALDLICV